MQDLDPFNPINIQLHKHHHTVNFYFIPYIFCTTLINLTTIRPPKKDKKATLTCFSPQILQIHWRIQLPPPKKKRHPLFFGDPCQRLHPIIATTIPLRRRLRHSHGRSSATRDRGWTTNGRWCRLAPNVLEPCNRDTPGVG